MQNWQKSPASNRPIDQVDVRKAKVVLENQNRQKEQGKRRTS